MTCAEPLLPILETVSEAMLIADASLVVTLTNQAATRWFGRDVSKNALRDLVVPEHVAAFEELVQSLRIGEPPLSAQLSFLAPGGGRSLRVRVTKSEIRERTFYTFCLGDLNPSVAQVRREHEAHFRELIDSTFEAILIHDNGVILEANTAAAELTGYPREELLGMRLALLAEPRADAALTVHGKALAAGENDTFGPLHSIGVTRAGTTNEIELLNKPVMYQGRRVRLTAFRDITAHKANERALKRRIEFEDLVSSISTEFINLKTSEIDRGLTDALEKVGRFAGAERAYILQFGANGLGHTHVWLPAGVTPLREQLEQTRQARNSYSMARFRALQPLCLHDLNELPPEAAGMRAELEHQGVKSCLAIPMAVEKNVIGIVGFDTVREQKTWSPESVQLLQTIASVFANAIERKKVQAGLEQKVLDRTKELRRKQLQLARSEKLASLGQLVAGVAHELNTPLGAIKSNNDILTRSTRKLRDVFEGFQNQAGLSACAVSADPKLKQLLAATQTINDVNHQAIERIVAIVSSLRKFARLDEAEVDTVDLHDGLETTLTVIHYLLRNRIEVTRKYGQLPGVECYPNQINQVFMNLLVNAAQAISGPGSIAITTWSEGDSACIEITDTGQGIVEADLGRIFDPGFTTKGVGVGTGLGLSIVHQIIEDHRGEIDVESEPGVGTTFTLRIPMRLQRTPPLEEAGRRNLPIASSQGNVRVQAPAAEWNATAEPVIP
jgi:PAS domain S-box-containing protein